MTNKYKIQKNEKYKTQIEEFVNLSSNYLTTMHCQRHVFANVCCGLIDEMIIELLKYYVGVIDDQHIRFGIYDTLANMPDGVDGNIKMSNGSGFVDGLKSIQTDINKNILSILKYATSSNEDINTFCNDLIFGWKDFLDPERHEREFIKAMNEANSDIPYVKLEQDILNEVLDNFLSLSSPMFTILLEYCDIALAISYDMPILVNTIRLLIKYWEKKLPYLMRNPDIKFDTSGYCSGNEDQTEISVKIINIIDHNGNPIFVDTKICNQFIKKTIDCWRQFKYNHQLIKQHEEQKND